jgi:hypothetical protein
MSTPVPEVFRIFSLHRYFMWAITMRDHYEKTGQTLSPTLSFFENEGANEAFMYLSYWYAGMYVVSEGWQELELPEAEIDTLLKSPHLQVLRRFRHGVYHYQGLMEAFTLGRDFDDWVESLALALARYFDGWIRCQTATLAP